MDPRTPIKKFAALLFKLANVRQQIFRQLQKEFSEVYPIGGGPTNQSSHTSGNSSTLASAQAASTVSGPTTLGVSAAGSKDNSDDQLSASNDSFVSLNNESLYSDFVNPILDRLTNDEDCNEIKLGTVNIHKTVRCGYQYFYLGETAGAIEQQRQQLLLPNLVRRYLITQNSNVKEMLRALRRESLMIIINYQFGFKRLEKIN